MISHLIIRLQNDQSHLSFSTNVWTLPNHCAFIAVTMHLEKPGKPLPVLLDFVEVASVRISLNEQYLSH